MKKNILTTLFLPRLLPYLIFLSPLLGFGKNCEELPFLNFFTLNEAQYEIAFDSDQIKSSSAKKKPIMTLYYAAYCPFSQEVLAYLRKIKKKIPMKDVKKDPQAKDELKKMGGVLEVPCLIINGKDALYSSESIIQWLSEHREELDPL